MSLSSSYSGETARQAGTHPTPALVYYDMTALFKLDLKDPVQRRRFWDETHLVVSLQGIVNRKAPQLFIRYNQAPDDFWWQEMTHRGGWLANREIRKIESLHDLLTHFASSYQGAVVWDERVPSTSNLAATLAGCEDLLCLRYDPDPNSLYSRLLSGSSPLKVSHSFVNPDGSSFFTAKGKIPNTDIESTGSLKCDPYLWLIEKVIKTGKANPHKMGYYLDGAWLTLWDQGSPQNHTLTNQDYVIAQRGILFDLNVWDDEATVDDPGQHPGTDVSTLKAILLAAYQQFAGNGMIHVAGFVPWAYKYTNYGNAGGKHEPVPTEWRYAEILSCFNAFMDADALGYSAMANASFFQHYPLPEQIPQNPKPTRETLLQRGLLTSDGKVVPRRYVAHYAGDYDAAAWMYWMLPEIWNDPARGKVPLSWAFNPNLADRFPLGMAWTRTTRTDKDFFIAGDSGAGYLNPGFLSEPRKHSGLPSGIVAWEQHNLKYFKQWDLSLVGFVIDGYAPGLSEEGLNAYSRFSSDGIVAQKIPPVGIHQGMPYLRMVADLPSGISEAADVITDGVEEGMLQFQVYRSILKSPAWYHGVDTQVDRKAGGQVAMVDMYTLLALAKEYVLHPELYQRETSSYAVAQAVKATPDKKEGLRAVKVDDGKVVVDEILGQKVWLAGSIPGKPYLYFGIDDDFAQGGGNFRIEMDYLDSEGGQLLLEYDSTDRNANFGGAYKAGETVHLTNTGTWKTALFKLPDARFLNSQNMGADFRFHVTGGKVRIREVRVLKGIE